MPNQLKKLYGAQVPAAATALITATYPTRITYMVAVNTDSSARTLKLWHGGTDDDNVILPATSLDLSGGKAEFDGEIMLHPGDVLYGQASVASKVTLSIFGEVNTS